MESRRRRNLVAGIVLAVLCLGGLYGCSIGVQNFMVMGLRAKAAEGLWNLEQIHRAELEYHAAHGVYVAASLQPLPVDEQHMKPFEVSPESGWSALGWPSEGEDFFRCQYQVSLEGAGFKAVALCDVDRDGDVAVFEATQDMPAQRTGRQGAY